MTGVRFPRSMIANAASERLLLLLDVEIVDDCDAELEDYARAWLASQPVRQDRHEPLPSTVTVQRALNKIDRKREAA